MANDNLTTRNDENTPEPSFVGALLKIGGIIAFIVFILFQHGNLNILFFVSRIALAVLIIYWIFWSFSNPSMRNHERKLLNLIGWLWLVAIVNIAIGLLSKFKIWQPFPVEWAYQTFFGLSFAIAGLVIARSRNLITITTILLTILAWGYDTVSITTEIIFSSFKVPSYLYLMLIYHFVILSSMMQGLRGICGIRQENFSRKYSKLNEKWIEQISMMYNSKSTPELQDFVETANKSEYSPETFEAIRRLIELRKENSLTSIKANLKDREEVDKIYEKEKEKEFQGHLINSLEKIRPLHGIIL